MTRSNVYIRGEKHSEEFNKQVKRFYSKPIWKQKRAEIINREAGRCQHIDADGNRCPVNWFVEMNKRHPIKMIVDHIQEINEDNLGDVDIMLDSSNLQLLCIAHHNQKHDETDAEQKRERNYKSKERKREQRRYASLF